MVVPPDAESNMASFVDDETAFYRPPHVVDVLIHDRERLLQSAARGRDPETAVGIDRDMRGAVERDGDVADARARREDEVVFELSLIAVIDDVHARVDVAILHFVIAVNAGLPQPRIVANQIVRRPGKRLETGWRGGVSMTADQSH